MSDEEQDRELELFRKANELEARFRDDKKKLERAKVRAHERLDGMADQIMDTLQYALASEDEALRVKAALALLDRLVPKVGTVKEGVEEVIEVKESRADVDEIMGLIEKKKKKEEG